MMFTIDPCGIQWMAEKVIQPWNVGGQQKIEEEEKKQFVILVEKRV
ncbi:MAG: hypothetical protein Q4Q17_00515 [Tissierellia bacterium]|nr:hypothetical protein [Tissierellia bacterium]